MELRAALHLDGRHRAHDERFAGLSRPKRLHAWSSSHRLDEQLAAGADPAGDPMLAHRAAKLTSRRFRHKLALGLREALARAQRPVGLSAAAPVGRGARIERARIEELADRLDAEVPVGAKGVAQASLLLTDSSSPLWAGGDPDALADALEASTIGLGR